MADNYLETRMEELRKGSISSDIHRRVEAARRKRDRLARAAALRAKEAAAKTPTEAASLKEAAKKGATVLLLALAGCGIAAANPAAAHAAEEPLDTAFHWLDEVEIVHNKDNGRSRSRVSALNSELISASELTRAACCNLGESFTTNPSVDVSYSDAATGARQIKLLGLSGSYVQMLTENVPNFRGVAAPYGLGYVPGPWMQSINVSKGASSVKNGFESTTGQINIEMLKPQGDPSLQANGYYDMMNKAEANLSGNLHLSPTWSAGILTHVENGFSSHDGNDDGFMDMPRVRQVSLMPRVAYLGKDYVFQLAFKYLNERRLSGQDTHHNHDLTDPYRIHIGTNRWEVFAKNAYIFDHANDGNLALITSGSFHNQNALYGRRLADIDQKDGYASLMYERKWNTVHALSAGLSYQYDYYRYNTLLNPAEDPDRAHRVEREGVAGAYAQYTLNLNSRFIGMAGLRYDWSDRYHGLVTPRVHLRWNPSDAWSLHASAGRGARSPHPLAEFSYMLASSRRMQISGDLGRETAWNFGAGATWTFWPWGKKASLTAEYYYTTFSHWLALDLDTDPHASIIYTSSRRSFSHAAQVELTVEPMYDLSVTAAWRWTNVRADYGQGLVRKPLTPRYKGLLTVGYSPMMGQWNFDVTCTLTGGGRMPTPYTMASGALSWSRSFPAFATLNAQVTRNFRHWSVYIGGENLTNYRQPSPVIGASNPWGPDFDATMIYGPLQGAMVYIGFRYNFTKYI